MKKFLSFISNQLLFIFMMIILGISFSALPIFFNHHYQSYSLSFKASTIILNYESFKVVKEELELERENGKKLQEDGSYKYPYSSFSYVDTSSLANTYKISYSNDLYIITVSKKEFNSWQQARRFLMRLVTDSDSDALFSRNDELVAKDSSKVIEESVITENQMNIFKYSYIGISISLIATLIILLIVFKLNNDRLFKHVEYDNINIYRFPIRLSYLKSCLSFLKSTKGLVTISILFALQLACKFIPIPSGFGNLGLNFTYLVFSVISMIFGPIAGLIIGFFSDTIGFFMKPGGVFFFGYTLSAMLSGFIYGISFYKTKISFTKCLFARLLINLIINTLLGSYWWWIVSDKTFDLSVYMLLTALPKNVVYLFPQSILLYVILRLLAQPLAQSKLIDKKVAKSISIF